MLNQSRSGVSSMVETPPYSAYTAFAALLQRAAKEPVPPRVDRALLQAWGIAAKNESAMLTSLRSLGLVDDEGAPTEDFKELRLSQPRHVAALRRSLARAYPGLVGAGNYSTDANLLRDYFVADRGLRGQMVDKATRFYKHLAEAASVALPVVEPSRTISTVTETVAPEPGPIPKSARETTTRVARSRMRRANRAAEPAVQLTIHVDVPFQTSEDELRRFFERVRRAWDEEGKGSVGLGRLRRSKSPEP